MESALAPVWARKKRAPNAVGIAALLALIFLTTLAAAVWFLNRADNETYSFMATGPANVRDAPTAAEGQVVAQLAEGDFVVGRVEGTGDKQWVEIAEGPLRGRFVWGGNLASEGPDDMLASTRGNEPVSGAPADTATRSPKTEVQTQVAQMDCSLLNASVATMVCARQVMTAVPNSSALPAMTGNLQVATTELNRRCSAEAAHKMVGTAAIVQQQTAEAYATVAPQAVYGGDMSAIIINACSRKIMGSLAQAGLL
jgi:hypothetical protein